MSSDFDFKVVKDAVVEAQVQNISKDSYGLKIVINNTYQHSFSPKSRESKLIYLMEPKAISAKFTGGTYVFLGDKLIDYRTGDYEGFIHSEDGIKNLADKIGCQEEEKKVFSTPVKGMFNNFRNSKGIFLGGEGEEFNLDIATLSEGGSFRNRLIHKWSPFSSNIITSLEVERLVCNNGMIGLSPFVTNKIPIINDWERNLKIVSTSLIPTYNDILRQRFTQMTHEQSTIYDVLKAKELILDRGLNVDFKDVLEGKEQISAIAEGKRNLDSLIEHLSVEKRLGDIYENEAFLNPDKSKQSMSDLTMYDVFNILTEACTHTIGSTASDEGIQKEVNRVVFDELNNKRKVNSEAPKISQESDHRRVFFGKNGE